MMHPYIAATFLVGAVAVAYGAYIIYKEFSEEPILLYNTRGREGYQSGDEDDLSEKNGLRRRRRKVEKSDEDDEQELLDKYSYLTALEQEIERKKRQLDDEERVLHEKELEIQNRKQHLQSISSQSSSNTDNEISPLTSQRRASVSSSNTSNGEIIEENLPVTSNTSNGEIIEEKLPVTSKPPQSVVSVKTISSDENDNDQPINKFSDIAAHAILSQHLSHITVHQQNSSDSTKTNASLISDHSNQQHNNSHFVAKSVASEETWSEVESVLSENIGSVMSSAVDIDIDEVDVIGH